MKFHSVFYPVLFLVVFLCGIFSIENVYATHNRAGEITYRYLGPAPALTYEVTILTYTRTSSTQADRPTLDSVYFGDGSPAVRFTRSVKQDLGNDISRNVYINQHTYLGDGSYLIHFEDPNRNEGVINIPFSVQIPFYVSTLLQIDRYKGIDNSPVLTYPPIDRGCVGRTFIHNANAYDPDGDSLSYELTIPRGENGDPVPGYFYPPASNSFSIDPINGDLIWDTPMTGPQSPAAPWEYNVAFKIIEWRRGVQIGFVTRDMQIIISECNNYPPVISPVADTCVLAGEALSFDVTAIDPDRNIVSLSATGGPFLFSPDSAIFTPLNTGNDTVTSRFYWQPSCNQIRHQPYYVQFRAQDFVNIDSISLVSLSGVFIRVIGPPPQNPTAVSNGNGIQVDWDPPACINVKGYRIYRRSGQYTGTIECPCDNGVPAITGYTLLDTTVGWDHTTLFDDNNGSGLTIGVEYCYLITAEFTDGSEGCASTQICASLKKDLPVLTNADVRFTDVNNGSMYVAWSKPTELDTILFPGPYEYRLYHSPDFFGSTYSQIAALNTLDDTIWVDTLIDTDTHPWSYKVELYYTDAGNLTLKGSSTVASSVYLSISPTDNLLHLSWEEHVPWVNDRFDIFRFNPASSQFDSIGTTNSHTYDDGNLDNGVQYCYYVRSHGFYTFPGFVDPIINRSQQKCSVPFDNVHPCSPVLTVNTFCLDDRNVLTWTNPNNFCADDVLKYYIYYAPSAESGYERIDSITNPTDTIYEHKDLETLAGCYKVTAVDSVGNETLQPIEVCVDTCRQYVLPSVFTPNGDGNNDIFHPCDSTTAADLQAKNCPPYKNVKDVEMKIFNRWGYLVFETNDKNINWDGTYKDSGKECPEGVYYYSCAVNFYRVSGVEKVNINGYVHIIRGK